MRHCSILVWLRLSLLYSEMLFLQILSRAIIKALCVLRQLRNSRNKFFLVFIFHSLFFLSFLLDYTPLLNFVNTCLPAGRCGHKKGFLWCCVKIKTWLEAS